MLKALQTNKDIVLLSGDKDSAVVILDTACYEEKINRSLNDCISKGVYVIEKNGNTLTELKSFQNFIYRNFKKHKKYKEMRPTSSSQLDFLLLRRPINLQIPSKLILII